MASIAKFDQWQNSAGVNYNTVIQTVGANWEPGGNVTTTSTSWVDTGFGVSITPKYATSKILILADMGMVYHSATSGAAVLSIARNGTVINPGSNSYSHFLRCNAGATYAPMFQSYIDSPATTSALTYRIYGRSMDGNTSYIQHSGCSISFTVLEIAQ